MPAPDRGKIVLRGSYFLTNDNKLGKRHCRQRSGPEQQEPRALLHSPLPAPHLNHSFAPKSRFPRTAPALIYFFINHRWPASKWKRNSPHTSDPLAFSNPSCPMTARPGLLGWDGLGWDGLGSIGPGWARDGRRGRGRAEMMNRSPSPPVPSQANTD